MGILAFTVLAIYTFSLLYITVYCVLQFNLLYHYKREPQSASQAVEETQAATVAMNAALAENARLTVATNDSLLTADDSQEWPMVTVQLPIYNEYFVIGRLIDAVTKFDYPRDRFEIHILDDSTDETLDVVADKVAEYRAQGFQIEQVTRQKRQGFKAGALRDGTQHAKGEFLAIFDADFVPEPDFLKNTIPHFIDPTVGVVQTRWEHINRDYSIITKLQALQLNVHFTVEQVGRMKGGHLLQFNGTAGVWRKAAIEAGGGWEADTLTEDFDLSIRTQLAGYRIKFLEQIGSPAELPIEMNSFKSQQHRWMKGGAETCRKMLPAVWGSELGFNHKVHATSHLMGSTIFLFVFVCGFFSVPLLLLFGELTDYGLNKNIFAVFLVGLLSIIAIYYVANVQSPANKDRSILRSIARFVFLFPLFLALSMGLALHNTVAVIEGYRGKKSPFVRTPKFNINSITDKIKGGKYITGKLNWITIGEGLLAIYFLAAVVAAFYLQNTTFIIFHGLLALGYGTIFFFSVRHLGIGK